MSGRMGQGNRLSVRRDIKPHADRPGEVSESELRFVKAIPSSRLDQPSRLQRGQTMHLQHAAHIRLALATVAFSNTGRDEDHSTLNEQNAAQWARNGREYLRRAPEASIDPCAIGAANLSRLRYRILALARMLDEAEEQYTRLDAALYAG